MLVAAPLFDFRVEGEGDVQEVALTLWQLLSLAEGEALLLSKALTETTGLELIDTDAETQ